MHAIYSVYQKHSVALDIMSDAMEAHIGHLSSYIGHFTYQMINTCHWTSDIMSDVFSNYVDIQDEMSDMSDVSDGFWVTLHICLDYTLTTQHFNALGF